jgi:hypothetical protein
MLARFPRRPSSSGLWLSSSRARLDQLVREGGAMRKTRMTILGVLLSAGLGVHPAGAITFGQPDGNRHPNVGALVAEWRQPGVKDIICSGTLIAPRVFLTAAHCTVGLQVEFGIPPDQVWVSFDSIYTPGSSPIIHGTSHSDPLFGHGFADPHDIAVVVLDVPVSGVTPARLPTADLLTQLNASGTLKGRTFTAVGYGTVRETKKTGPHAFTRDGIRRFAFQMPLTLNKSWITYSMNPSTGGAGTCFGDSGGPHFMGGLESNLIVSITVTGDAMCRATDKTYRLDTSSARNFLRDFVSLP